MERGPIKKFRAAEILAAKGVRALKQLALR